MDRREFITLLGGSVIAAALPVRAEQAGKIPRIGVLAGTLNDEVVGSQFWSARVRHATFLLQDDRPS